MRTYCLACREHIKNIGSERITVTNKVVRDKSRCAQCLSDKSRFIKQKFNKKVVRNCLKCKKNTRNIHARTLKTKNGRLNLSSKYAVCSSKKSKSKSKKQKDS